MCGQKKGKGIGRKEGDWGRGCKGRVTGPVPAILFSCCLRGISFRG